MLTIECDQNLHIQSPRFVFVKIHRGEARHNRHEKYWHSKDPAEV
jgi:hypothetical protein